MQAVLGGLYHLKVCVDQSGSRGRPSRLCPADRPAVGAIAALALGGTIVHPRLEALLHAGEGLALQQATAINVQRIRIDLLASCCEPQNAQVGFVGVGEDFPSLGFLLGGEIQRRLQVLV